MKIELVPDLEHCIETVTKKRHAALTGILLKSKKEEPETEEQLLTLELFLQEADFPKLRSESERYLAAGKSVRFLVYLDKGIPQWEMQVT